RSSRRRVHATTASAYRAKFRGMETPLDDRPMPGPRRALGDDPPVTLDLAQRPHLPRHLAEALSFRDQDFADQLWAIDEVQSNPADANKSEVAVFARDLHGEAERVAGHRFLKGDAQEPVGGTGRVLSLHGRHSRGEARAGRYPT